MSARVARTASIGRFSCRMPAVGQRAARVTYAVLVLTAQIALLSPGVCDACVKGCCESDHCCCLPVADRDTERRADRGAAGVTAACRCQLEPRQIPPADLQSGGFSGRREIVRSWTSVDADVPVAWLPPLTGRHDGLQSLACAQASAAAIPSRPVRVLYGVWRN